MKKRILINHIYADAVDTAINRRIKALHNHLWINSLDQRWLIQEEQAVEWIKDLAEAEVEHQLRGIELDELDKDMYNSFINKINRRRKSDVDDWFPGFSGILELEADGILKLNK